MDTATIQVITQLVSTVGFPMVVAGYLLMRFEKIITANTTALQEISAKVGVKDAQQ